MLLLLLRKQWSSINMKYPENYKCVYCICVCGMVSMHSTYTIKTKRKDKKVYRIVTTNYTYGEGGEHKKKRAIASLPFIVYIQKGHKIRVLAVVDCVMAEEGAETGDLHNSMEHNSLVLFTLLSHCMRALGIFMNFIYSNRTHTHTVTHTHKYSHFYSFFLLHPT